MMEGLIAWMESMGPVKAALVGTLFTWAMTAAGAALVFPFKSMNRSGLTACWGSRAG